MGVAIHRRGVIVPFCPLPTVVHVRPSGSFLDPVIICYRHSVVAIALSALNVYVHLVAIFRFVRRPPLLNTARRRGEQEEVRIYLLLPPSIRELS